MADSDAIKEQIVAEITKAVAKFTYNTIAINPMPIVLENEDKIVKAHFSHITDDGRVVWDVTEEFKHPMKVASVTIDLEKE